MQKFPECGCTTRSGDLAKFQEMQFTQKKPLSAAALTRSAGRSPALGT